VADVRVRPAGDEFVFFANAIVECEEPAQFSETPEPKESPGICGDAADEEGECELEIDGFLVVEAVVLLRYDSTFRQTQTCIYQLRKLKGKTFMRETISWKRL
jgi:hypothetical protein